MALADPADRPCGAAAGTRSDRGAVVRDLCDGRPSVQEVRLDEAIMLATRAEAVHRRDDAWPHGLADQLEDLQDNLVAHHQREQAVVFPMLLRGVEALPGRTIDEMVEAHADLMARWRVVEGLTRGFEAPAHACATWRRLYALCSGLQDDFRDQVSLENRMLRPGGGGHPG